MKAESIFNDIKCYYAKENSINYILKGNVLFQVTHENNVMKLFLEHLCNKKQKAYSRYVYSHQ